MVLQVFQKQMTQVTKSSVIILYFTFKIVCTIWCADLKYGCKQSCHLGFEANAATDEDTIINGRLYLYAVRPSEIVTLVSKDVHQ